MNNLHNKGTHMRNSQSTAIQSISSQSDCGDGILAEFIPTQRWCTQHNERT